MIDSVTLLAAAAPAAGSNFLTGILLPFGLMALVMYFLLIRPQQQQRKKHQEMLSNLKKNDMVVTSGGLLGKVVKLSDDELTLNLGQTEVRIVRAMVVDVRNKDGSSASEKKD